MATSVGPLSHYGFGSVSTDHTIVATFAPTVFTITATAGAGGAISPAGVVIVSFDADKTFTIAPATGYVVDDVKVDGASIGAVTSHTIANVQANHTIAATFKRQEFTITATAGAHGSISPPAQ